MFGLEEHRDSSLENTAKCKTNKKEIIHVSVN